MSTVFEEFVRNFYKVEQQQYEVGREYIEWIHGSAETDDHEYLPRMETDTTLRSEERVIVIETKYYKETLSQNWSAKLHSANLYQLFAYLKNLEARGGVN